MVMRMAYAVACQSLPAYSNRFSRRDFTLPQLFACLVVKDMLKRSYRSAEAVPRDSPSWLADIGMTCAPDHTTPHRAAKFLLKELKANRLLATPESRRRSGYTSRWQVETGNSMMKRNQGAALAGRTASIRKRDMRLRVITHNMMVL